MELNIFVGGPLASLNIAYRPRNTEYTRWLLESAFFFFPKL